MEKQKVRKQAKDCYNWPGMREVGEGHDHAENE